MDGRREKVNQFVNDIDSTPLDLACQLVHFNVNRRSCVVKPKTRRVLRRAHIPPTKVFSRLAINKTILKPRLAAATVGKYLHLGFSRRNKGQCSLPSHWTFFDAA